jgi:hypothetical protein
MFSEFLLFVFATIGLTHIIVDPAAIALPFRTWADENLPTWLSKMFSCYQCCGAWIGFLMGALLISYNPIVIFACGMTGSFLSTWAATYLNYLEAQSIINLDSDQ